LAFIEEWERSTNPNFDAQQFTRLRGQAGTGAFRVSVTQLTDFGCIGIYAKKGRTGGTYAAIEWAIHFANWLDAEFYVETIEATRKLIDNIHGRNFLHQRFAKEIARDNASESYNLVAHGIKHSLPDKADIMVRRHFGATEAE
jgi:hypothetical protein